MGERDSGAKSKRRIKMLKLQEEFEMTPAEQKRKEVENLRGLPYIAKVEQNFADEESKEAAAEAENGQEFTLKLMVRGQRKTIGLEIKVSEKYPQVPCEVSLAETLNVTGTQVSLIESRIQAKAG